MPTDLRAFENQLQSDGITAIAGVDEAGRGPLAGPVVAAAVILPTDLDTGDINDSKKLTHRQRDQLFDVICESAVAVGVGIIEPAEIDQINILQASLKAMAIAVERLDPAPAYLLIDGKFTIDSPLPQQALVKGDSRSVSIAAASIVAKVRRDRIMADYHNQYPQFGFDRHKGYPTRAHRQAIRQYGPCRIHRRSFKGVKEVLCPEPTSQPQKEPRHVQQQAALWPQR